LKKILSILFFLATVLTTNAQPNLPPQEADSLFAIWNDETQPDTSRLKAMHRIAWSGYLFTKPDSAFYFAQLEYNLAKEKGEKKYMAAALNTQGVTFSTRSNYDNAIEYHSEGLKVQEELGNKQGMAAALNNIGLVYYAQDNYNKAIDIYSKSLGIQEKAGDKDGTAAALNNIGLVYAAKGDYSNAIDYYSKSLKIGEEIGDKQGMAVSLGNIGSIYFILGDYNKAIDYDFKSLKIEEELGDKRGIASSLNNIGNIYKNQGNYDKAMDCYVRSLRIEEEIGDKHGIASSLNKIGTIYKEQADDNKAMDYYAKSLEIEEEIGDKQGIANSLMNIGIIYNGQGDYQQALSYINRSLIIAQEIGGVTETKEAANLLYQTNKKLGKHKNALQMYELYITVRDSIESEANQKAVIRQEFKYAYEKKAAADSVVNAEAKKVADAKLLAEQAEKKQLESESKRQKLENKSQQQFSYFLYGILALAVLFGAFIFNRFRVTQKQKGIIETQKNEVEQQKEKVDEAYDQLEEKNTEILDSINYAKRIQSAILPPDKLVKEYLQNSFILYKPKDIVAGDFYWMEPFAEVSNSEGIVNAIPLEGEQKGVMFAAADCTGHGVPGAMVSVVCHNAMNRAVREFGLTDPGKILDKTREIVIQEFEKSEDEVKDGMDIALCSLKGNQLSYAGANNPLWIIPANSERHAELIEADVNGPEPILRSTQNDSTGIIEIKATKQPIGKVDNPQPFTTHTFELQPNDVFYIFSDGYVDQFGGERGKKFKAKAFRELLLSIQDQPMDKQRELINQAFEKWRGDLEQVDDVCVIGVKNVNIYYNNY
jgi:tetratricopeptide (TPR) repeat protein/serine phosphatase RsbU (regulator of sigma subunit)